MKYPNFYESIQEAKRRLHNTVVCYDGFPYFVLAITDGWADDIFRIYVEPLCDRDQSLINVKPFGNMGKSHGDYPDCKHDVEHYMQNNPDKPVFRKQMNSPKFRKYRPYPLGFVNYEGNAVFAERTPTRRSEQGMTSHSIVPYNVEMQLDMRMKNSHVVIPLQCEQLSACIRGVYPDIQDCIEGMNNPAFGNPAVAFDRNFAVVRGPIGMLFLAYKTDVVGVLPNHDTSLLRLGTHFKHCREVIETLSVFGRIV